VLAAARAEWELGFLGSGVELGALGGAELGDDEKLSGEIAIIEQREEMGIGLWDCEFDGCFVVAGEFLRLDLRFDGGLSRRDSLGAVVPAVGNFEAKRENTPEDLALGFSRKSTEMKF